MYSDLVQCGLFLLGKNANQSCLLYSIHAFHCHESGLLLWEVEQWVFRLLSPSCLVMLLCLCFAAQVSSIPVVDDNDSLLDIYCRRLVVILFICL